MTNVKTVVEIEEIKEVKDKLRKLTFSMAFVTKWEDPRIKFKRDHQTIERSTDFGFQCLWWPYTGFVNYNSVKDLNTLGALRRYQIESTQNGVRSFGSMITINLSNIQSYLGVHYNKRICRSNPYMSTIQF